MFNAFFKVIPNFYSCKANVKFTIVCLNACIKHVVLSCVAEEGYSLKRV